MRHHSVRGMTLVEFMVAIVIGLLMVAALATLIANQSQSRAEIDKSGRLIENGRYAVSTIAGDLQMAGYYGEMATPASVPAAVPNPCATAITTLNADLAVHVQGYDSPTAALPTPGLGDCVKNHKPGTDIVVVRHADPDTADVETAGVVVWTKLKAGQVYLQTGLDTTGVQFAAKLAAADGASDSTTFNLTKRDKTTAASPRKYLVRTYYISNCSVPTGSGGTCTTTDDGGTPIPTLKRVDLSYSGTATALTTITIAEGIENMQVDYGIDLDGDGYPDVNQSSAACNPDSSGYPNAGCTTGSAYTTIDWSNVVTATVHLIARSTETVPGFTDTNTYTLGTAGAASAPAGQANYRRRVFTQSVRIVNPMGRKVY